MGDDRPPVYWEDDNLVIRASALGTSCLWELTAAGQGHRPGTLPATLIRAFAEGNDAEPVVIERLKEEYQVVFLSHQEEGNMEIAPNVIVRHHPDGIANLGAEFYFQTHNKRNLRSDDFQLGLDRPPRTVVVEVKWLSDALWQKFVNQGMSTVIHEYAWQGSVMIAHHGFPLLWVGGNKGLPPDENGNRAPCPDQGKLHFELRTKPPIPMSDLVKKATMIKEAVTGEDILESGKPCDQPTHWPCRYQHLRPEQEALSSVDGEQHPDVLFVQAVDMERVDNMVRQYIYSKGQADEATDTANRNRDSLLALGEGFSRIITETWDVPIHGGDATTSYFDFDAMRDDGIDVEKYRRTKPKSRYLNKRNIKRRMTDGTD